MTLSTMQTLLSYWLDDPNFGYFSRPQMTVFLNNALKEVQKILLLAGENYYLKTVKTQQVANQRLYTLPSDFLAIHRLEVVTNPGLNETRYPVEYCTPGTQDAFSVYGQTIYSFYILRNNLVVVPIASDNTKWLRMYYSYQVLPMAVANDTPDIPDQYHEMVVIFAGADCLLKDGRDASLLLEKKKDFVTRMNEVADERILSQPRQIVVTSEDLFLPW